MEIKKKKFYSQPIYKRVFFIILEVVAFFGAVSSIITLSGRLRVIIICCISAIITILGFIIFLTHRGIVIILPRGDYDDIGKKIDADNNLIYSYRNFICKAISYMTILNVLNNEKILSTDAFFKIIKRKLGIKDFGNYKFRVLTQLVDSYFINYDQSGWFITKLGIHAIENIDNKEEYPTVTKKELIGYRVLVRNCFFVNKILSMLIDGNEKSVKILMKIKINNNKGLFLFPREKIINDVLFILKSVGWISESKKNDLVRINKLGIIIYNDCNTTE